MDYWDLSISSCYKNLITSGDKLSWHGMQNIWELWRIQKYSGKRKGKLGKNQNISSSYFFIKTVYFLP